MGFCLTGSGYPASGQAPHSNDECRARMLHKSLQAGIRSGLPGYERLKNVKTRTAKDHPVIDASGRDPDLRVRFPLVLIEKTDYSACAFPDSLDLRLTCV
jgi:hypothetical protein